MNEPDVIDPHGVLAELHLEGASILSWGVNRHDSIEYVLSGGKEGPIAIEVLITPLEAGYHEYCALWLPGPHGARSVVVTEGMSKLPPSSRRLQELFREAVDYFGRSEEVAESAEQKGLAPVQDSEVHLREEMRYLMAEIELLRSATVSAPARREAGPFGQVAVAVSGNLLTAALLWLFAVLAGAIDVTTVTGLTFTGLALLASVIPIIMIVFGGLRYVTSSGDSANISSAKNTILYAAVILLGIIVISAATSVVLRR